MPNNTRQHEGKMIGAGVIWIEEDARIIDAGSGTEVITSEKFELNGRNIFDFDLICPALKSDATANADIPTGATVDINFYKQSYDGADSVLKATVQKTYSAIVAGAFENQQVTADDDAAIPAATHFQVVITLQEGGSAYLVNFGMTAFQLLG